MTSSISSSSAITLKEVLGSQRIDFAKVEAKWGALSRVILSLNLDEENWIGGDSTLIYSKTDLTGWNFEEKRYLASFLLFAVPYTDGEIAAIRKMLGVEADRIAVDLSNLKDIEISKALGRGGDREFSSSVIRLYRRNLRAVLTKKR